MNKTLHAFPLVLFATVALTGCLGGSESVSGSISAPVTPISAGVASPQIYIPATYTPPVTCANGSAPTPASVRTATVTSGQIDLDPSVSGYANPATITFSVLMPASCPESTFPLVLQSHGYGGNRVSTLAADGTLKPADPHFTSLNELVAALPYYGYMVISYDERGHGDSYAANARIIDPGAETQDARAILDYAYANLPVQKQDAKSGIAKDMNVGTIGLSYGGGFEFPLAALDGRIDTMVPNGTWHDLLYSLLPGDGVKLSFDGLLCLLATTATTSAQPNTGVHNTPIVAGLCNQVGPQGLQASRLRSRADLVGALGQPTTLPRPVTESEVNDFFYRHGTQYFQYRDQIGQAYDYPRNTTGPMRAIPVLLLQGNRDVLFNMTEAWRNSAYYTGGNSNVHLLTTEGGHMNPLVGQREGTADCGKYRGINTIMAWLDFQLKGIPNTAFTQIPRFCLSVADTVGAPDVPPAGVLLNDMPVGALSGTGALPAYAASLTGTVVSSGGNGSTFLPMVTIQDDGLVLAGIPTVRSLTVTAGSPVSVPGLSSPLATVAYVGVAIQRNGANILVDDQVTSFAAGTHVNNRGVNNSIVELPGVGEQLQKGDVVGLVLYENHIQYSSVVSLSSAPSLPSVVGNIAGVPIPAAQPGPSYPNPYTVTMSGVGLPIFKVGVYAGSVLSK